MNHDPLCPWDDDSRGVPGMDDCQCAVIAKVRADERAKARSLVEALPETTYTYGDAPTVLRADVLALLDGGSDD